MADINYNRDYGLSPGSPLWFVMTMFGDGPSRSEHRSQAEAEEEAERVAITNPGRAVHILAVVATVQTSPEVVGQRFDPKRSPEPASEPISEFAEVEPPAAPQPAVEEDQPL